MLQRKYVGRWLGLLCVLFGLGWSARAHAVELQLHWKKGQAFKIYWNTEQVIDQVAMGQKTQIQQTIGTGYIFRTIDVKAGGIAKVEVLFKRIYFKVQTIQGVFEYNSAKPPEKIPPLAQGFAALLGRRFVMEITSHGKVVGLEGVDKMLEDVMRSLQAGSPQQRAQLQMQLKQQFGNVALRQMMEQMMAIYPERSIKVGESWSKTLRMGGAVPMVLKRRWKLVALRGGFAFLRVNAQILPNKLGKPLQKSSVPGMSALQQRKKQKFQSLPALTATKSPGSIAQKFIVRSRERTMGGKTLTRADLAEAVVEKVGLPRNESQDLVERVLEEISGSLAGGEAVKLSSFGSFGIRQKGERVGRNPKTGKEVPITPRRVLVFRPSNIMKDRINKGHSKRAAE